MKSLFNEFTGTYTSYEEKNQTSNIRNKEKVMFKFRHRYSS
jgi:hypothetical protein